MKKKYIVLVLSFILLCLIGYCLLNPKFGISTVKSPYEMEIDGKIISYYDKEEDIDRDLIKSVYDWSMVVSKNEGGVYVNDDGKIRILFSDDKKINTYKDIHVGDKASKIEKSFKYVDIQSKNDELDSTYRCYVFFDDKYKEINTKSEGSDSVSIVLYYFIEDNKVAYIMIEDTNSIVTGKPRKSEQ